MTAVCISTTQASWENADSDSADRGRRLPFCSSNKFPGEAEAVDQILSSTDLNHTLPALYRCPRKLCPQFQASHYTYGKSEAREGRIAGGPIASWGLRLESKA